MSISRRAVANVESDWVRIDSDIWRRSETSTEACPRSVIAENRFHVLNARDNNTA
jgi:hypothetical protein